MAGLTRLTSPPVTVPPSARQGCLVLASAPLGFPGRWQRAGAGSGTPRRPRLPQVQVGQVQPAELADPQATVGQPGHDQPVPRRARHAQQALPGALGSIFGCRRRGPFGASGFDGIDVFRAPAATAAGPPGSAASSGRASRPVPVHAQRRLVQVEALQAGRRRRQSRPPVKTHPARHGSPRGMRTSAPTIPMYR